MKLLDSIAGSSSSQIPVDFSLYKHNYSPPSYCHPGMTSTKKNAAAVASFSRSLAQIQSENKNKIKKKKTADEECWSR